MHKHISLTEELWCHEKGVLYSIFKIVATFSIITLLILTIYILLNVTENYKNA